MNPGLTVPIFRRFCFLQKYGADAPGDEEIDCHGKEVIEGGDDRAGRNGRIDADPGKNRGENTRERPCETPADEAELTMAATAPGRGSSKAPPADISNKINNESAADPEDRRR